jgi:hypothetical protein
MNWPQGAYDDYYHPQNLTLDGNNVPAATCKIVQVVTDASKVAV